MDGPDQLGQRQRPIARSRPARVASRAVSDWWSVNCSGYHDTRESQPNEHEATRPTCHARRCAACLGQNGVACPASMAQCRAALASSRHRSKRVRSWHLTPVDVHRSQPTPSG